MAKRKSKSRRKKDDRPEVAPEAAAESPGEPTEPSGPTHGEARLWRKLEQYTGHSPTIAGGDIDAAWEYASGGEETVGGSQPTPDQDRVDELGRGAGVTYDDEEPLRLGEKELERDRDRWEEVRPDSEADRERERERQRPERERPMAA
jgi:hypothetical protein